VTLPAPRRFSALSALAIFGCSLVYVVALGTGIGRRADARALTIGPHHGFPPHPSATLFHAVEVGPVVLIVLVALLAGLVALYGKRLAAAAVATATLAGANLTTYLLKPVLAHADPLSGESARSLHASFPSGHATAAMSVALAVVILAPHNWRGWVAAIAAVYAACVGLVLVALVFHYPSDVAGGYLIAIAWAGALSAIVVVRRGRSRRRDWEDVGLPGYEERPMRP
jgi:membrane-associated phospholipid phosphatase